VIFTALSTGLIAITECGQVSKNFESNIFGRWPERPKVFSGSQWQDATYVSKGNK
jgi:hypothetical protein